MGRKLTADTPYGWFIIGCDNSNGLGRMVWPESFTSVYTAQDGVEERGLTDRNPTIFRVDMDALKLYEVSLHRESF